MSEQIEGCPQPETPILERAWADGQRPEPKYSDAKIRKPVFGEWIRGVYASESNPHRDGMYVRTIRRTGRMNPGTSYEITDGKGDFWEYPRESVLFLASRPSTPDKAVSDDAAARSYDAFLRRIGTEAGCALSKLPRYETLAAMRAALTCFASQSAEAVRDGEDVAEFEVHAGGEYFSTSCGHRDAAFADAMHYVSTLDSEDGTPEVFEVTRRKIEIKDQSHD